MTSKTAANSNLSLGYCLIWETERPYENVDRRSPIFTFRNCELCLKLVLDTRNPPSFDLYIAPDSDRFSSFVVRTYYRSKDVSEDLFVQRKRITHPSDYISRVNLALVDEKLPKFKFNGNFTIVCTFDDPDYIVEPPYLGRQQKPSHFPRNLTNHSIDCDCMCPPSTTEDLIFSLKNLSEDFEALLDSKTLPDMQLIVEGTSVPCHRAVLVARSKVFGAMFQHDMTESTSGVVDIKDIDLSTIEVFLKYLYSGNIPDGLSEDVLVKLFVAGDKYEVAALKRVSGVKLMRHINEENCMFYLSFADTHSDQEFKDAVANYIVKNDKLIKSSDWKQFSLQNPKLAVEVYHKYAGKWE